MDLIDPSGCNKFIELTVVAQDSNLAQVHTCSGDGTYTQVTFINGHPPPFEIGAIISVWNFEKDNSLPGNKGIIIDLSGTCRWVWKSPQETTIEPVFCELFSGLGGWTRGLKAFDKESVVLVEKDATVARACAISLNLPLCHVEQVYHDLCQGIVPTSCVLVGDLGDKKVWTILSFFHIRIGCMSPPLSTVEQGVSRVWISSGRWKDFRMCFPDGISHRHPGAQCGKRWVNCIASSFSSFD